MRIDPLEAVPLPVAGTSVGLHTANSWLDAATGTRLAYIATNSTQRLSFATLQTVPAGGKVVLVCSRPSRSPDYPYGVVLELHLRADLDEGQTVYVSLAQSGATTYYPPQPISD